MGRTACTEPQCLYKGDLYLLYSKNTHFIINYVLKLKHQSGHLKLKANVVSFNA